MNWNEYKILSEKTLSTEFHCEKKEELMLHAVMGILTEVEELLDNHLIEGNTDEINRSEEIFDITWYLAIIGRQYQNILFPMEVTTSIEDPFEMVLQIVKRSLKLLDFLKKKLYYNKPINEDLFTQYTNEIIGILVSYANFYSINIESGFDINISKLRARYSDKFSSERAINRDLDTERTILEGK